MCPLTQVHSPVQCASMPIHARLLFSLLAVRLIEQRQIESKVYFSAVARGEESAVVGGSQFSRMWVCVCISTLVCLYQLYNEQQITIGSP